MSGCQTSGPGPGLNAVEPDLGPNVYSTIPGKRTRATSELKIHREDCLNCWDIFIDFGQGDKCDCIH